MHMTEANDNRAQKNSQRLKLYKRKGWKGFVHGYKDWIKATEDEGRWDEVNWGENGDKSGAKAIESDGLGKTVYHY